MGSYPNYTKRGELHHALCTIPFLTDYVMMASKYPGKIPVVDNRRGTGIIYKTCEDMDIRARKLYARDDESLCMGSVLKCGV